MAKISKKITTKVLQVIGIAQLVKQVKFNEFLEKIGIKKTMEELFGIIVYWTVLLVFLVSASEVLGIQVVLDTLNKFIAYLPHVIGAFVILVISFFIAKVVKDMIASSLETLNISASKAISSVIEILLIGFGLLIAFKELGFDMTVFTANITVILAGAVLVVSLSLGLGTKSISANIVSRYYINQIYKVGDTVVLCGKRGKIEKITPVAMVIKTEDGTELYIPHEKIIKEGSGV